MSIIIASSFTRKMSEQKLLRKDLLCSLACEIPEKLLCDENFSVRRDYLHCHECFHAFVKGNNFGRRWLEDSLFIQESQQKRRLLLMTLEIQETRGRSSTPNYLLPYILLTLLPSSSFTDSPFDLERCGPAIDLGLERINRQFLAQHKIYLNKVQAR